MTALLLSLILHAAPVTGDGHLVPESDTLSTWEGVILQHLERHPRMTVADLYKLLHQGALGSEHAVPDEATVRQWLDEELAVMGETPHPEPLVDTIAPGGVHVRIHLRPYVAGGGNPQALLAAFIQTANAGTASPDALEEALAAALALAQRGAVPWDPQSLSRYFLQQAEAGYPAEHHSRGYWSLYRPAYRVIAGTLLDSVLSSTDPGPSVASQGTHGIDPSGTARR